jgi:hypothetical protein
MPAIRLLNADGHHQSAVQMIVTGLAIILDPLAPSICGNARFMVASLALMADRRRHWQ